MIRVLVLIMITGFLVGVVALSSAAALGGPDLAARNWRWIADDVWDFDHDWGDGGWGDRHGRGHGRYGETVTREMAWDGSSKLELEIPAEVDFTQAAGPGSVVIVGPREVVERVELRDGVLSLRDHGPVHGALQVRITAPNVDRFELDGADRLTISNYRQNRFIVDATGSAEVAVQGEAKAAMMDLSGSAEADLSALSIDEAYADLSGSSEATIAPKVSADLDVSGSGEVVMLTRPPRINSEVGGGGEVTFRAGGAPAAKADML